jgi:glycerol-3-phosphate acyltransferase PlsX
MSSIKNFAKTMDYKEYGGAIFLGIKKPVIKAHGSSDENLFYYTIKQAEEYAQSGANDIMIKEFEKIN